MPLNSAFSAWNKSSRILSRILELWLHEVEAAGIHVGKHAAWALGRPIAPFLLPLSMRQGYCTNS